MNGPLATHIRSTWRIHPLVRLLSSVRLGVVLLLLILVYACIVSAVPQVRGVFEMSEMQAFRHWAFTILIQLFCLSLILTTIVRCRWDAIGAGAIIVHAGLLLLIGGASWYFGTKVEGDVMLFTPRIELMSFGSGGPQQLGDFPATAGQTWSGRGRNGQGQVRVRVLETRGAGLDPVTEANLEIQINDAPPKPFTLTSSNAMWQEPAAGLAVSLQTFPTESHFYDDEVPALYFQAVGSPPTARRCVALHGLPWFRERYLDEGYEVHDALGREVLSKRTSPYFALGPLRIPSGWFEPWRLPLHPAAPDLPFDIAVTGYLPYISETGVDAYTRDGRRLTEAEAKALDPAQLFLVPRVEPLEMRRPGLGRRPSAIRLKLTGRGPQAGWSASFWCPFSPYPHIDAVPITVRPAGGTQAWQITYSRFERDLHATLAGRSLSVTFFPGRESVESWRSDFIVQESSTDAPQPAAVYTNHTCSVAGLTLFQSGAAGDHWSWTVLGVGNRHGIWPMTLGCVLVVLGTLYAFYVKPILLRRRASERPSAKEGAATREPARSAVAVYEASGAGSAGRA